MLVGQSKTSWSMLGGRPACAALGLVLLALLSPASTQAQNPPGVRKVVYKVAPKYPRELKQNAIGGIVRLSISISPNGSVGKISPIGGNPILVDAATLCSTTPARELGLVGHGVLAVDAAADLLVLDAQLSVVSLRPDWVARNSLAMAGHAAR